MYYAIHTTKTVGVDVLSVPTVTIEGKERAMEVFKAQIKADAIELNESQIRWIGARVEYTLQDNASPTGLFAGDVIARATVKRPVNSPQVEIWASFEPGGMQQRISIEDL